MADFADVVAEIKNTNKKLDTLAAATDPKGAAAAEDKKEKEQAAARSEGYLKTIADAITAGGAGGGGAAAGQKEAKKGGLLSGIGGALGKMGIGAGVAMGGLGALFAGGGYLIKQLMDFDGKKVYTNVKELLKINDLFDGPMDALKEGGSFFIAMTAISGGLIALGIGSAVGAGGTALAKFMGGTDWTQTIVDNVETLLSMDVATGVAGQFAKDMAFISAGLIAFSIGSTMGSIATGIDDAIGMFTNKGKKDGKTGKGTGWAKSIKDNVETLLTIKTGTLTEAANIAATMGMLGAGLIAFSFGSAAGAAATGIDQAISMFTGNKQGQGTGWATKIKSEVETLLSIQTGSILDTAKLVATLGAIGLGLIVFSLGKVLATGAEGAASAFSPSEKERKDGHEKFSKTGWAKTIVAEVTELMKIGQLSFFDAAKFVGTMGMVGMGLVAFSLGKVAAGTAGAITDKLTATDQKDAMTNFQTSGWAQKIVDEVTTLLSIAKLPLGNAAEFVTTMGLISAGLVAFAVGKAASGTAEIVNRFANIGKEKQPKSFATQIVDEVKTLLGMTTVEGVNQATADTFSNVMGTIATGLLKFSGSKFIDSLAGAASKALDFLSGNKSPIAEMKIIAAEAANIERGAAAIEKVSAALDKVGNVQFKGDSIKMKDFAEDLVESVPVIEKAIMGGTIKKFLGFKNIKLKGLASSDVKWNTAADNISILMAALGMKPGGSPTQANPLAKYVEVEKPAYFNENKMEHESEEAYELRQKQIKIWREHEAAKKRKSGGTLTPGGAYLVGEGGPEMIIPSSTGTIMNAQRTLQMQQASLQKSLGGMGGGGPVVNNMPVTNVNNSSSNTSVQATPLIHPSSVVNMVNSAA